MKATKWFFNKVVLNPRTGFYVGIPACFFSAVGNLWIGGVACIFMLFCLAVQLSNPKLIE